MSRLKSILGFTAASLIDSICGKKKQVKTLMRLFGVDLLAVSFQGYCTIYKEQNWNTESLTST